MSGWTQSACSSLLSYKCPQPFTQVRSCRSKRTAVRCSFFAAQRRKRKLEEQQGLGMSLDSILQLTTQYKGILMDQFGVLHDGQTPYPGAIDAVNQLAAAGMQILVLSNSSRRSEGALDKLARMGFNVDSFRGGVITSGEVTYWKLLNRMDPFWEDLGNRCLHFTWSARGAISLQGLGLQVMDDPEKIDFILAHGTEALGRGDDADPVDATLETMHDLLRRCAKIGGIPLVVANPDIVTVDGRALRPMPGALGRFYSQLGGEVRLMGKPNSVIYDAALTVLGLPRAQVLAVGDSLEHDIRGGQDAGVDTLFIAGGIHAEALEVTASQMRPSSAALEQLCKQHGVELPTYVMPYLTA